jgi:hypothetical protein
MLKERQVKLDFKLTLSQKAGPNGKISLFNTGIDAIAFIHYPRNLINLLRFNMIYGFKGILLNI